MCTEAGVMGGIVSDAAVATTRPVKKRKASKFELSSRQCSIGHRNFDYHDVRGHMLPRASDDELDFILVSLPSVP
jgi:hypothetical protein